MRTVHRDMEALSMAGVPVFALRGARGGWQLDEGWRTQVPALDEAELLGLLMAQPRVIGDRHVHERGCQREECHEPRERPGPTLARDA